MTFKFINITRKPLFIPLYLFILFVITNFHSVIPEKKIIRKVTESEIVKFNMMSHALTSVRGIQAFSIAKELYNEQEYKEADKLFQISLLTDPDNQEAISYRKKIHDQFQQRDAMELEKQQEEEKKLRLVNQIHRHIMWLFENGQYENVRFLLDNLPVEDAKLDTLKATMETQISQRENEQIRSKEEEALLKNNIALWYQNAKQEYEKKHFAASLALLQKIIDSKAGYFESEKALQMLPLLQEQATQWAYQQLKKADIYWDKKQYQNAYYLYLEVLTILPDNANALRRRGQLVRILLETSKEHYEKGVVYLGMNMISKAQREFQLVKQFSPNTTNQFYVEASKRLQELSEY